MIEVDVEKLKIELRDRDGCIFNDIIYVPMRPSMVQDLGMRFKDLAERCSDFRELQGHVEMCLMFEQIHDEWDKRRNEKVEKNVR